MSDTNKPLARVEEWEARSEKPLTVLALVFLVAYAVPILAPDIPTWAKFVAGTVDVVVWVIFVVDYVARIVIADDRLLFVRKNLLDTFLVLIPPLRPLRLIRVTSLLIEALWRRTRHRAQARLTVFVIGSTAMVLFLAALAVLDAERGQEGAQIETFGDSLWWALVTVTTVGYGDLSPVTTAGRVIAVALMASGIGLIGFITGAVTSWVIDKVSSLADEEKADVATVLTSVHTLHGELTAVRRELAEVKRLLGHTNGTPHDPETQGGAADQEPSNRR
ncbi:potassium channel family protein [Stackebrandtia soli]|uniref:potassium channel family protein n=1 Tax=Stackebrandtia soli TaxID=1892856 RepID=UPI0039EAEB72